MISNVLRAPLGCAVVCAALMLAACGSGSGKAKTPPASLTVEVITPQSLVWPRRVTANGALRPWQEAVISAETGPLRISSLNADVGSYVRRGAVLATLNPESLLADRSRLQAQLAEAKANLAQADSDVARARQIGPSGALSEQQIQKYQVAQQTAQATVASAEAQLRSVEIQLGQTQIRAVDDGVVSSRSALLGKVVNSGEELFRIVRQGRIEWQAELDSRQLAQVAAGQRAWVTLPGGTTVEGRVRLVSPTLNGDTSRGLVYVQLPPGSGAKAGMYASGTIEVGSTEVLTLPDTAVLLRDGHAYVFLVQQDQRVRQLQVTAGQRRDSRVEVAGVPANARVVKSGGSFLSDGVTVQLAPAKAGRP